MLYEKLPSPTSTRLIKLLPGVTDDPLACQLQTVDLESDDLNYPAISYVWGDPTDKKPIQCVNETLMIPRSLHSMLKRLRHEENEWIGWADAICINQSEDPEALRERAHQVEMMGTIFSKAKLVLVYLGEKPEGYEKFLCVAETLLRLVPDNINAQMFDNLDFLEVSANPGMDSLVWDNFDYIVSRPWYLRVWTMQEFVLAQDIKMCIGDYAIHYANFRAMCAMFEWLYSFLLGMRASETLVKPFKDISLNARCRKARRFLDKCRDTYKQDKAISLATFVEATLQLKTTYARDRLYGGYGICERTIMQKLPVDFGLSVATLSQRLSTLLLADGHSAIILEHCAGLNDSVPTWCISLDGKAINLAGLSISPITISHRYGVYTAAGSFTQPLFAITADPRIIATPGCIIGSIKSITDPYPHLHASDAQSLIHLLSVRDWIERTLLWLGRVHALPAVDCSWDKLPKQKKWTDSTNELWRTLISDLLCSQQEFGTYMQTQTSSSFELYVPARPRPEFVHYFQAWLQIFRLIGQRPRHGHNIGMSSRAYLETKALCDEWMLQLRWTNGKRVGVTYTGRLALLPRDSEVGDEVCVFKGVNVPFVVRRKGGRYRIVGSCYLHGMMDGQALEREDWRLREILIE